MADRTYSTSKGTSMSTCLRRSAAFGYSLVELLVVLAIVGILAIAGVTMIGNRQSGAVRGLLDELEGALNNAQQAGVATGRDVAIVTWGTWDAAAPLRLALGDASTTGFTEVEIRNRAEDLLKPTIPAIDASLTPAMIQAYQSVAVTFRFLPNDAIQSRARIVTLGSDQWKSVMGKTPANTQNDDIGLVVPFSTSWGAPVDRDNSDPLQLSNLFPLDPAAAAPTKNVISGNNKRFTSSFFIPIVGTTSSGAALPGGPMGMIVVLANGSSIYKFYNPGARDSDGHWRRL